MDSQQEPVEDLSAGDDGPGTGQRAKQAASTAGHRTAQFALVAAGVVMAVFAFANLQPVSFSWLVGQTEVVRTDSGDITGGVPLIVLLLSAFVLGAIVGRLLGWRALRRRR